MRRFLSPRIKKGIIDSFPYRLLSRCRLRSHEIRFSCELTTRCNIACDICTRTSFVREDKLHIDDMDRNIISRIIQEIKKFHESGRGVYFVPLGLGEPLLFKDLFDVFREVKAISQDIGIVLVTNGLLLNEACCDKLFSLKIDEITVSLNATSSATYQRHMGVTGYDKVCRNIENLITLRNKGGYKFPRIYIQYIDYENNQKIFKKEINQWANMMARYDKCYVHPIINQAGFFDGSYGFNSLRKRFPCSEPLWRVAIKVNGDIYPCDSSLYSGPERINSLYLGNIMTDSPFDMPAGPDNKRFQIVENMRRDDYSWLPECARCNTYKLGCNCYFGLPVSLRIRGHRWI